MLPAAKKSNIAILYQDSKLRVTTESKLFEGKPTKIFRIEVFYFNSCLHANISPQNALALSDAIYDALPEDVLDTIVEEAQKKA